MKQISLCQEADNLMADVWDPNSTQNLLLSVKKAQTFSWYLNPAPVRFLSNDAVKETASFHVYSAET